ncbi:haloacid dehalogenase [Paenibacillus albidus]|uniref:Haloacid dehalogenase n=1 Tax=Paenibacillus albidus TaxID=2041023 RepID=A0A917CZS7_9BACL|nr:HAD family hydrolase [Paenibacillus albidus]GGG03670.1 haloacid dehalogenase [Paenibacillus albidus]
MNSMIEYLWFDLGYTLVKTDREEVYQDTLKVFQINKSRAEITLAYHRTDKLFMREYQGVLGKDGRVYQPWYIGCLNYFLGVSLPIDDVIAAHRNVTAPGKLHWKAFDYTIPTLRSLRQKGYRLGLISNWNETAREVLADNRLEEELDEIIISSEVGIEKPDPAIFEFALAKADVTAKQSLYIGDNYYDDVKGSQKVGMECLLINPYGSQGIEELNYSQVITSIQEVASYLELMKSSVPKGQLIN